MNSGTERTTTVHGRQTPVSLSHPSGRTRNPASSSFYRPRCSLQHRRRTRGAKHKNLDSVEESIQNLLSALYPPYEATAPTLLSQLFQIIDSRYQRDALRCFLDFLVPAKHILDTVQQAACAQYSNVLFLCEGWPLCLRDQVVVHLAPIDPSLLQPGDFYLQVTPFCDQSARIVVCSLLKEEGLTVEVVEETPVPETSYPCIFSSGWLDEINQDRQGIPLRQCLVATERGVVRLPWERVAVPDFVELARCAGSSMASAAPSHSPLTPPPPPPLPNLSKASSSNNTFPLSSSKKSGLEHNPGTIQNSVLTSSSHPAAFSVETRICPAKHGIAVSLCLVDTRTSSSSQLVKIKGTETEHKPIGWVSPNTWDSRFTETNQNTATKTEKSTLSGGTIIDFKGGNKGAILSENTLEDKQRDSKSQRMSRHEPAAVATGEYIDILQAKMLFDKDQSITEEQQSMQIQTEAQKKLNWQNQPILQLPFSTQSEVNSQTISQDMSGEVGPQSVHDHSLKQHPFSDSLDHPQCVRAVRFAEKPCTPCMARRQGGKVTKTQELRCRYRDSYQAAIQNPVNFGAENNRGNILAVVEEDADTSQSGDKLGAKGPWRYVQDTRCDLEGCNQSPPQVGGEIKESGEINCAPCRKPKEINSIPGVDSRVQSDKSSGFLHNVNTTNPTSEVRAQTINILSTTDDPRYSGDSNKQHRSTFSSTETSEIHVPFNHLESHQNRTSSMTVTPNFKSTPAPQNRRDTYSDRRCSSLSTAVVNTSEKCELIIVEGQNVRRKEISDSRAEIPQLHVVKCKNSTAFRLVSPKINRKKNPIPVAEQLGTKRINDHKTENLSQMNPSTLVETHRTSQQVAARPRPDHLPLGSPDPKAHPVYSGVASLTGCRDKTGRAIIELYGHVQGWESTVTSHELFQMLLYFYSITRKEIREAGMTLIFDARKKNPQPQFYKALMALHEWSPRAVNSLVLLVDKENNRQPERCPGVQTDLVTSMKALVKLVEVNQLSSGLDGTAHGYCDWLELHQRLFPFVNNLHEASSLLLRATSKLEELQMTETVQAVQQCMMDQRTLMRDVLEDSRLVGLQREGGAILARLRKESDLKYPHCEDLSDAVDSVTSLYNYVEEQAHILVQRTNASLEHLEYVLQLREMEGHFIQFQQWLRVEGERHLPEAESVEDSGDRMEQILNSFTGFLIEANDRRHHAMSLVSEAERLQQSGLSYPETGAFKALICTFKSNLEDFLCRAEACGRELQIMVNICYFCEQAVELASECTDYLNLTEARNHTMQAPESASWISQTNTLVQKQSKDSCLNATSLCQSNIQTSPDRLILQSFQERFLHFSPEKFQEVKVQASSLRGSRGMHVWNAAWLSFHEAQQQLQERMQELDELRHQQADPSNSCEGHFVDVVSTNIQTASPGGQRLVVQSTPGPQHLQWEGILSGAEDLSKRRPVLDSNSPNSTIVACSNIIIKPEGKSNVGTNWESKASQQSSHRSTRKTEREAKKRQTNRARSERDAAALSESHPVGCQWFPWRRGLGARSVSQDSCTTRATTADSIPGERGARSPSCCSHRGQPSCRILQEAQKFQISRHGSFCSDNSCVSSQGAAGGNGAECCKHSSLPPERYGKAFCLSGPQENASSALRVQHVMEELVITEREYVRSLGYILTHYLPLMDRLDIPQDLRGKRGVIFGNLEKVYDFHSHYFLPELEACERQPAMVARCFLRHSESFGLYSLYSKNKPQSDALILHRRHDIFKKKQQELGDLMDLSSYLLRPIQRISKYSLLLQDMLALVGSCRSKEKDTAVCTHSVCGLAAPDLTSIEKEKERREIQAAADLIQFQMRHGNDLLTMDAIQDCDVNLKEQGELIRQDEFTVFFRKKKCVRRVFLFEHLILFSKPKRTDIGNDVYVYKQSFKTNDIGMTHNSGVSGLCFEIWFRRRKSEDTYTLKASSTEVKKAWTTDLERILWNQAAHSRELRLQERVFMGTGHSPFMDIQPSDAAICDRAVGCVLPGRIPVACCSHRGLDYPRPHSIGSGSTTSTTVSQSSSSSGRGSLPPTGYLGNLPHGADTNPGVSSPEAVTENELNSHQLLQHHPHPHCDQWKTLCPLIDSTDSSGESMNQYSSPDHSCLSAISGEVVDDSSSVSQRSEQKSTLCRTPSLRKNSSPAVTRKKPGVPPKPPHLAKPQGKLGKSTEV
ncbi:pleckstrin homology domain-containing family G member 4B-like [Anableps anableps]